MIELKNISRTYIAGKTEVQALHGVSLSISGGEFVAIMGHSGSGKSTLLNVLGCLDRADSGSYKIMGRETGTLNDNELSVLRGGIFGFVFQQFYLLPGMTVRENVSLPLIYSGDGRPAPDINMLVESVGLLHRINHYSNELSGGEQQRAAIARALVNKPLIIFADEPTGNLDSKTEEAIMDILSALNGQGVTVIMVTHEKEIAAYAGRIIYMKDGEIISDTVKRGKKPAKEKKPLSRGSALPGLSFMPARPFFSYLTLKNFFSQALISIAGHKMRSLLSMLGILFGVASVIAMLGIGQGAKNSVEERLKSMGSNLLSIRPGSLRSGPVAMESGAVARLTERDYKIISELPGVKKTSPAVRGTVRAVYGNKNWSSSLNGVGVQYESIRASTPVAGRFFTEQENRAREKLALLGITVARELFGAENPVGKIIKLNRVNFKVIGVLPPKGAAMFGDRDDIIIIPINTAMYRILGEKYISSIDAEIASPEQIPAAIEEIKTALRKEHSLPPGDEESFSIRDMTEVREAIAGTTDTIGLLLGIVAAISLIVGGIGIMNIMLVTVKERTREIGIRRAIGAYRTDIKIQFLIESAMLTSAGGIAGILLGSGTTLALSHFAGWAVEISFFSIALSTTFSVLTGLLFGLWPAFQASKLRPVEAFRHE